MSAGHRMRMILSGTAPLPEALRKVGANAIASYVDTLIERPTGHGWELQSKRWDVDQAESVVDFRVVFERELKS